MSKYQFTESDIYIPGADIPRNLPEIKTPDLLHEIETALLQQAYTRFITELDSSIRFDKDYFKSLHHNTFAFRHEWKLHSVRPEPVEGPVAIHVSTSSTRTASYFIHAEPI